MSDLERMKTHEQAFRRAVESFEACLETPFVPGELELWIQAVEASFRQLEPLLMRQTEQVHSAEFAEIAEEDPGLLQRVEQMRNEDQTIVDEMQILSIWITSLVPRVADAEPDEVALKEEMGHIVAAALAFVISVRRQEVAVRTWLVEAFTRDRGAVD